MTMLNRLAAFLNYRPVTVVAIVGCIHTIIYGLAYSTGLEDFQQTLLYASVEELINPVVFGLMWIAAGVVTIVGLVKDRASLVARGSSFQGYTWIFATLVYWLNSAWSLGVAVGLCWAFIAGYTGYVYKFKNEWILDDGC